MRPDCVKIENETLLVETRETGWVRLKANEILN